MGQLLGIFIFGSVARGDDGPESDLDILAIVEDGKGKIEDREILSAVPMRFNKDNSAISWYGYNRIWEMYKNGELFAWHLSQENIPVYDPSRLLQNLGQPSQYKSAVEDIGGFQKILASVPSQIFAAPANAVYEMGLIYVCLRNIAMSASWHLNNRADFSRYSPFHLVSFPKAPLSEEEYNTGMACRLAGQRGVPPPHIEPRYALRIYDRVMPWIDDLKARLKSDLQNG